MTVPVFTPTPVITPVSATDMPAALGSQIGVTTDANFTKTKAWADALDTELKIVRYLPASVFVAATTNHVVNAQSFYMERGKLATVFLSVQRSAGTALVSTAQGLITPVTVATLVAAYRPPFTVFGWSRCTGGPLLNLYVNPGGSVVVRGCSAASFTYSATWVMDFEIRWVKP